MSCPTRPVMSRNPLNVAAPRSVIATYATTTVTSGWMLPLPSGSSGGMPLSMPSCTSQGPMSWQSVFATIRAAATDSGRRCGRMRTPSRRRLRLRRIPARPGSEIVDVFGGDAAPRVHLRVAGEVERSFGIDIRDLVGFRAV